MHSIVLVILVTVLFTIALASLNVYPKHIWNRRKNSKENKRISVFENSRRKIYTLFSRLRRVKKETHHRSLLIRAGNTDVTDEQQDFGNKQKSVSVIVTTSFGSSFLDKKKKFILTSNTTVADLKDQIASKFPGSPPKDIQRLFFSSRLLSNDSEIIANISIMQPVPLILDTISGTGVYNRSLSISQAVEAYVSTLVQQSYLGNKLNSLFQQSSSINPIQFTSNTTSQLMESIIYRNMFITLNESLYSTYSEEIEAALQAERNPEVLTADTAAWRQADRKKASPLAAALAKEFDLNLRGLVNFLYYSVVLLVFACFGTSTATFSLPLLLMVPLLWVSKLRQLRLLAKIAIYLVLPTVGQMDFILPLLPATWQTIAKESIHWPTSSDSDSQDRVDEEKEWLDDVEEEGDERDNEEEGNNEELVDVDNDIEKKSIMEEESNHEEDENEDNHEEEVGDEEEEIEDINEEEIEAGEDE